ncbi:LLM class flavin-dependent oxidoreductase [Streptomyces goshikiensis]|uniref:LLM class flavin-dependent oxidoreductase n=1 Tax=Streptomyces goshikiensis TaxID=1942 RepID=UPI00332C0BCC
MNTINGNRLLLELDCTSAVQNAHDIVALARSAESQGFHTLGFPDHFLVHTPLGRRLTLDCFTALATAAAPTRQLVLATHVASAGFRTPLNLIRQTVSLQNLTEGRFELGIGAGWHRGEAEASRGPAPDTARGRLLQALEAIEAAWPGSVGEPSGPPMLRPDQRELLAQLGSAAPRPLVKIAAGGDRLIEIAAAHADVIMLTIPNSIRAEDGIHSRAVLERQISVARRHAPRTPFQAQIRSIVPAGQWAEHEDDVRCLPDDPELARLRIEWLRAREIHRISFHEADPSKIAWISTHLHPALLGRRARPGSA